MMRIFAVGRPRKASLSLSLNAIVILILAIAMLGLGLAFIRGIFKSITAKVDEAVQAGELTNPPTADNVVTMMPAKIELKKGTTESIKVAFMNTNPKNFFLLEVWPTGTEASTGTKCMVGSTAPCIINPVFSENPFSMEKDQINVWTIAIKPDLPPPGDAPVLRLYTAKICEATTGGTPPLPVSPVSCKAGGFEYRKDFIVTIKP